MAVDLEQAFELFATAEVSDGIDLSQELGAFKASVCEGKKHANAATVQVLFNGKKLGYDDRTLEKMGVKPGDSGVVKLTVTKMGAIPSEMVSGALRSMGYAPTETQLEEIKELVGEAGMTMAQLQKAVEIIEAEPIGQQQIDEMKSVLAKEGHFKAGAIRKIFATLDASEISPEEVEEIMKAADPSGSGQIDPSFFNDMI